MKKEITIQGVVLQGTLHQVDWSLVETMIKNMESIKFRDKKDNTSPKSDSLMFAGLKPVKAEIKIDGQQSKKISNMLTGVFSRTLIMLLMEVYTAN